MFYNNDAVQNGVPPKEGTVLTAGNYAAATDAIPWVTSAPYTDTPGNNSGLIVSTYE
jgi:hypothetical protein